MPTKNTHSFPSLFVPEKEKNNEWCEQVVDAIISYMGYQESFYNKSKYDDVLNYQIYNGQLNQDDYKYVTEQYGITYPARLVNYPIITPKVDLLVGEEIRRPLDMKVTTINKEAVLRKHDHKVGLMMRSLLDDMQREFKKEYGLDIKGPEGEGVPIPEDIDTYMKYSYREMIEETAQDGLEYIIKRYNVRDFFRIGFRDMLVTGKEFYKIDIRYGDPTVRRVDPRMCIYEMGNDSDYIDDSAWFGEERWMSVNEIMDEFRDELTKEDIVELEAMRSIYNYDAASAYNSVIDWVDWENGKETRIRVITAEWKAIRPLKYKIIENKFDDSRPFKKMVDNSYKKRKGETIETKYVDDVWTATKIGGKLLLNAKRRDNQVRSVDDPGRTPLSYVGCVRNNTTGKSVSLVDMLKNIQMLYNIVVYHIELAMARSGGKAVVYDTSQLPTNLGMDIQQVLYHLKTDGIIPINSKEEGNQLGSTFNQFQQIDFTLSQSVQQLINLKVMLEDMAGSVSGVTRQREGAVGQYEYVGNVQRSVMQSATITEGLFYSHAEVKQRVLERLCNLMKVAWAGGKRAGMILGDGAYKFLNVMPDIALQDFGLYVGDSGKDDAMKQTLEQLAQAALQAGQIDFLSIVKILKSDTMSEAENILERAMEEMQKAQAEASQAEMQQAQAQQEAKQAEFEAEAQLKQIDNEAKIQVAQIGAQSRLEVAKMQAEVDRDIHDAQEEAEVSKKMLDHYIREDEKESDEKDTGPPKPGPSEDEIREAKEKIIK
jgi:hypothetical protein